MNKDAVNKYKKELKALLLREIDSNGSYSEWYDDLTDFRNYMIRHYIKFHIRDALFSPRRTSNQYGDIIDHHSVSYLAPLDFTRIGWNGKRITPLQQIKKLSDWIVSGGGRFIYVALPNKGVIYPQLICDDPLLYHHKTSCAPQWRKFVNEVVDSEIEIIDIYPVFRNWADSHSVDECLFSKKHNISGIGAKLVADTITEYLMKSADDVIRPHLNIEQRELWLSKLSNAGPYEEKCYLNYHKIEKREVTYRSIDTSDIAIFGDCNLQGYSEIGAGISANLAYNLQYPVHDAGRLLVFDDKREVLNKMSLAELQQLRKKKIVIYLAFASASFTRSSTTCRMELLKRHSLKNFKWCNFELK